MVKSVMGILLAASAMVPGIASARQIDVRGDVQVDAQRDGDRGQPDQNRPPRGQQQGRAQVQAGAQVQGQNGQDGYRGQGYEGQGDRGQYREQGQGQQGQYQQGQYGGQGGYPGRGYQNGQRPNFGPNAPGGQGGYAGRGNDGRGYDDRGGNGGQYAGRGGPGYQNGYPNGGGNRGGWNNGWRGDQRYDWNRYRQANRGAFHLPRYYAPGGGYGYRRFSVGVSLGLGFYGQNYWINNPYAFRLPPAYGPYRWVRYYNDALLVDVRSGYVADVVYGIFW